MWEAVIEYIRDQQPVTGQQVQKRFSRDDPQVVAGVLNDLTHSGLTYRSGRAYQALYRVADAADFFKRDQESRREAEEHLVWLTIYRQGPLSSPGVAEALNLPEDGCRRALDRLLAEGRVRPCDQDDGPGVRYVSERFEVPVGAEGGWEAAVLDHFQALVAAVCVKLRAASSRSQADDTTGGGTYTFEVWPGHPLEAEARGTLARVRAMVIGLRERIDRHNAAVEAPELRAPVVFYMGQYAKDDEPNGGAE